MARQEVSRVGPEWEAESSAENCSDLVKCDAISSLTFADLLLLIFPGGKSAHLKQTQCYFCYFQFYCKCEIVPPSETHSQIDPKLF